VTWIRISVPRIVAIRYDQRTSESPVSERCIILRERAKES